MARNFKILFLLIIILIYPVSIKAGDIKYAEVFDPKQDKVIKTMEVTKELNSIVTYYVKKIDEIYDKNDPVTDDGYAIRVPLDPSVKIENKWLRTDVKEVYIIIPENESPFMMIFENENRLICFPFKGDINHLSKLLCFQLKTK